MSNPKTSDELPARYTLDCGCVLTLLYDGVIQPAVDHCPLHAAAEEMRDELIESKDALLMLIMDDLPQYALNSLRVRFRHARAILKKINAPS